MLIWLVSLLLVILVGLVAFILFLIVAFRASIWWGLGSLFVPFVALIFAITHWGQAGLRFVVVVGCLTAYVLGNFYLVGSHPELMTPYVQKHPEAAPTVRLVARTVDRIFGKPAVAPEVAKATSEKLIDQRDELMQRQDAYDKHATDLNATYQRLQTERAAVKGTGPSLAAYNVKAAQYQDNVRSLAAEKARIDALQQSVRAAEATLASTSAPKGPAHH